MTCNHLDKKKERKKKKGGGVGKERERENLLQNKQEKRKQKSKTIFFLKQEHILLQPDSQLEDELDRVRVNHRCLHAVWK